MRVRLGLIQTTVQAVIGDHVHRARTRSVADNVQEAARLRLVLNKACIHRRAGRKSAHLVEILDDEWSLSCSPRYCRSFRICSTRRWVPSASGTPSGLERLRARRVALW